MLAHHMESYLRVLRQRESRLTDAGLDALVGGVEMLERTIAARRDHQPAPNVDQVDATQLAAVVPAADGRRRRRAAPRRPSPRSPAALVASHVRAVGGAARARHQRRQRARAAARARRDRRRRAAGSRPAGIAFEFLDRRRPRRRRPSRSWQRRRHHSRSRSRRGCRGAGAAADGRGAREPRASAPSHVVRVDLTRLDDLMRMIGDLVISRARLDAALDARRSARAAGRVARRPGEQPDASSASCAICAKA